MADVVSMTQGVSRSEAHPPSRHENSSYHYDIDRDIDGARNLGPTSRAASHIVRVWPRRLAWTLILGALGVGAVVVWWLYFRPVGIGSTLVACTAALVPVAIALSAVWWLDRFTPQPRITLTYAFAWGAVGAILLTTILGERLIAAVVTEDYSPQAAEFFAAVIQAPVVEESTKSLGLLFLLIWGRRFIAGPIDGVVYAALMGAGFAFTENILYFANAFAESQMAGESDVFWATFFLRGIMSPFAHVSFTALCGLGLGIAQEQRSVMLAFGWGLAGLALGMALHALWNGSTFFIPTDPEDPYAGFFRYYLTVQVPIFALLGLTAVGLRWREARVVTRHLSEYGRHGWFTVEEVHMLKSLRRRAKALRWARQFGAVPHVSMRHFIMDAVALAVERQSAIHGRPSRVWKERERELLARVTEHRRAIDSLVLPVVREGERVH